MIVFPSFCLKYLLKFKKRYNITDALIFHAYFIWKTVLADVVSQYIMT